MVSPFKVSKIITRIFQLLGISLCILVGIMPFIILYLGEKFPIEFKKDPELYENGLWYISFFSHASLGGIPLLLGWTQFIPSFQRNHLKAHRRIGKVYVFTFLITATNGFLISFFATFGWIPAFGFATVAIIGFYTTLKGFLHIKNKNILLHQKFMYLSYGCCFSAVNFRLVQSLLSLVSNSEKLNYQISAWAAWVPTLLLVYYFQFFRKRNSNAGLLPN